MSEVKGISCKKVYQQKSMVQALGFESSHDLQCELHGYSHLINAGDVTTVAEWLFENGYDIIKIESK